MLQKPKQKNRLVLVRNRMGLVQKQVADLLGQKTVDLVSRYERGTSLPNLKTAFKLGIIYKFPVEALFYGYYETCLMELRKREMRNSFGNIGTRPAEVAGGVEFCTFEEKLMAPVIPEPELDKVRQHIVTLVDSRSKRMNHHSDGSNQK